MAKKPINMTVKVTLSMMELAEVKRLAKALVRKSLQDKGIPIQHVYIKEFNKAVREVIRADYQDIYKQAIINVAKMTE